MFWALEDDEFYFEHIKCTCGKVHRQLDMKLRDKNKGENSY